MRLFYARKKSKVTCSNCGAILDVGEIYVRTGYKNSQSGWYFFFYHPDCFIEKTKEKLEKSVAYFILNSSPPKKKGRPKKYVDTKGANKLLCLINYHKRAGHDEEVAKLKDRLIELRRKDED